MIRTVIAVVAAAGALAACQPATPSGAPASEVRLATKLVDAGVPIPLEGEAVQQLAYQQVQGMMFQDGLSPEQARQVMMGISKNLEAAAPEIKEEMIKSFTDQFNVKELELLVKFVTSKEGQAIQEKMPLVGQGASEVLQKRAQEAGVKALADLRSVWPTPPAPAPSLPQGGVPGQPGAPGAPVTVPPPAPGGPN